MIFKCFPTAGFSIDDVNFIFLEQRELVGKKIGVAYRESNQVIELGEDVDSIVQRRDIYKDVNASQNLFFLNYDENDLLLEVEIHNCNKIKIFDLVFDFDDEIELIAKALMRYSEEYLEEDGEYIFFGSATKDLLFKNKLKKVINTGVPKAPVIIGMHKNT